MQRSDSPPAERRLYRLYVIKTALGTSPSFAFLINFIVPHRSFSSELQPLQLFFCKNSITYMCVLFERPRDAPHSLSVLRVVL